MTDRHQKNRKKTFKEKAETKEARKTIAARGDEADAPRSLADYLMRLPAFQQAAAYKRFTDTSGSAKLGDILKAAKTSPSLKKN